MVEINWTKFAIENLVDIGEYIAKDSQNTPVLLLKSCLMPRTFC
jgi:hypothetical protein